MQSRAVREPIYKDLLEHGITKDELENMMDSIKIDLEGLVTEESEINKPVRLVVNHTSLFASGLSYAMEFHPNDLNIIQAFLSAGANPYAHLPWKDSILVTAIRNRKMHPHTFDLFLKIPDLNIYVTQKISEHETIFSAAKDDAECIASLFRVDPVVSQLHEEKEIKKASDNIARNSGNHSQSNIALHNAIENFYIKADDFDCKPHIENQLKEKLGNHVDKIVLSYMFFASKPKILKTLAENQESHLLKMDKSSKRY